MSISDRLDQIEADIPLAARSPEMAQHFTADHGTRLLTAVRAVLDLHIAEPYAAGPDYCEECEHRWPCDTYTFVAAALGEEARDA